ncbi:hypothetical protein ACLI08_16225 [Flavobacterium sp. RNTU_13]|uniref:hypothetical protein n=1 Tax=Flavobacterium sp. RNTU_13 TaxID=3375145 RepID=UPI00398846D0
MRLLRRLYNIKAGSLLESVIALTIIAICLFVATMVYAAVFTSKTSMKHYEDQASVNELFYLYQLRRDSVKGADNVGRNIAGEVNGGTEKMIITYKDSAAVSEHEKIFYLNAN